MKSSTEYAIVASIILFIFCGTILLAQRVLPGLPVGVAIIFGGAVLLLAEILAIMVIEGIEKRRKKKLRMKR